MGEWRSEVDAEEKNCHHHNNYYYEMSECGQACVSWVRVGMEDCDVMRELV